MLNLTDDGYNHQKVFNVGINPNVGNVADVDWTDLQNPPKEPLMMTESYERAFTFSFFKPGRYCGGTPLGTPSSCKEFSFFGSSPGFEKHSNMIENANEICVQVEMASLCYTHSPIFLKELSLCMDTFQEYMTKVSDSIKSAATEVAMGLVQTRSEMTKSEYTGGPTLETPRKVKPTMPSIVKEDEVNKETETYHSDDSDKQTSGLNLKLNASLQTPVIVLPRTPDSTDVLVGKLGKISIKNYVPVSDQKKKNLECVSEQLENNGRDMIYVSIKEMAVYSLDLAREIHNASKRKKTDRQGNGKNTSDASASLSDNSKLGMYEVPIVHNTEVEFTLQKLDSTGEESFIDSNFSFPMDDESEPSSTSMSAKTSRIEIKGRVVNQLKVTLSKSVFEQILQTLDNIAPPDDDEFIIITKGEEPALNLKRNIHNVNMQPSLSSLKLDDVTTKDNKDITLSELSAKYLALFAEFELPSLNVKMTGDVGDGEQGLVNIHLQDFRVAMEKTEPYVKDIEVFLQSLVVEDLLGSPDSTHRQLMVSYATVGSQSDLGVSKYLSSSCPSSVLELPPLNMPPSLPTNLNRENVWNNVYDHQVQKGRGGCSVTAKISTNSKFNNPKRMFFG